VRLKLWAAAGEAVVVSWWWAVIRLGCPAHPYQHRFWIPPRRVSSGIVLSHHWAWEGTTGANWSVDVGIICTSNSN
jgi:hypothetical protein